MQLQTDLTPVEYSAQRVLTTEQLAQFYECDANNIKKNFNFNKERFLEGKHYFKLEGEELSKLRVTFGDLQISPMTRTFYLWTKRGAARHAKMLSTEKAWQVFEALEENYFDGQNVIPAPNKIGELFNNPDSIIKICQEWKAALATASELRDIVDQQAVEIAELTPKASYYDNILQSKELLPISAIAKDYGMSGQAMNELLKKLRIQYRLKNGIWLVYQNYAEKGYTRTKTFLVEGGKSVTHTYWTQKGRLFLYEKLKQNGCLPLIEQADSDVDKNWRFFLVEEYNDTALTDSRADNESERILH